MTGDENGGDVSPSKKAQNESQHPQSLKKPKTLKDQMHEKLKLKAYEANFIKTVNADENKRDLIKGISQRRMDIQPFKDLLVKLGF